MFWVPAPIGLIVFNDIYKMYSKIGFEMSSIVVEAIRGRCASFMVLKATVSEIFGDIFSIDQHNRITCLIDHSVLLYWCQQVIMHYLRNACVYRFTTHKVCI